MLRTKPKLIVMKRIPAELQDVARKKLFYGLIVVILACSALAFAAMGDSVIERIFCALLVGSALSGSALFSLGHKRAVLACAVIFVIVSFILR